PEESAKLLEAGEDRRANVYALLEVVDRRPDGDGGRLTLGGNRELGPPLRVRSAGPPEKEHEPGERGEDGGDQEQLDGPARRGGPRGREGPGGRGRRGRWGPD